MIYIVPNYIFYSATKGPILTQTLTKYKKCKTRGWQIYYFPSKIFLK